MERWRLDPDHTEVKFKAKHLLVTNITGEFTKFNGYVESEGDDFSKAKVFFEADINSINTRNEQRDKHLRSADFFDAENHPKLKFVSKSVKKVSDSVYEIKGDMTIRGITKEITIKAENTGVTSGFGNTTVAGWEITGKVNRFDFGLKWNTLTEAGGVVVGEEIKIEVNAEVVEEVPEEKEA
jgi:polyisoprenoid-binding protein YceI